MLHPVFVSLECMKTGHQSRILMSWLFSKTQGFTESKLGSSSTLILFPSRISKSECKLREWYILLKEKLKNCKLWQEELRWTPFTMSTCVKSSLDYDPGMYVQLRIPQINNSLSSFQLGEMFQVALSSFSHLTFRAGGIMLEKIFCKSTETSLFINPLFGIRPYFSPITLPVFGAFALSRWDMSYILEALCAPQTKGLL